MQNNDLYIEGDKIRKVNKEKFLTDDEINRIKVSVEKMNEKERRQYLFTELKNLMGKEVR